MEITLTQEQFVELKKLIQVVKEAQNQGTTSGEVTNAVNSAEWSASEVKFTLG